MSMCCRRTGEIEIGDRDASMFLSGNGKRFRSWPYPLTALMDDFRYVYQLGRRGAARRVPCHGPQVP